MKQNAVMSDLIHANPPRIRKVSVYCFNGILISLIAWVGVVVSNKFMDSGRSNDVPILLLGLMLSVAWMLWGVIPALHHMILEPVLCDPAPRKISIFRKGMPFIAVEFVLVTSVILFTLPCNPNGILKALLLPLIAHSVLLVRGPWFTLPVVGSFALHFALLSPPGMDFFLEAGFTIVSVQMVVATERSHAEARKIAMRLEIANSELAAYALQAEELAVTRERSRMAREIHDLIGHYLTVIRVQLEAALRIQESQPAKALDAVRNARECAGEGLREIRNSVESLRSGPLENRSLCEALLVLVTESERAGQLVNLVVKGSERPLGRATALTIYRASQEALTNARKHAPEARVTLELQFDRRGEVVLRASDDGPGNLACSSSGFGLTGLQERAALVGGSLVLDRTAGSGFSFVLTIPS